MLRSQAADDPAVAGRVAEVADIVTVAEIAVETADMCIGRASDWFLLPTDSWKASLAEGPDTLRRSLDLMTSCSSYVRYQVVLMCSCYQISLFV